MEILFKTSGVAKSNPSIRASKSKSSGFACPSFPLQNLLTPTPPATPSGVVVGLTADIVRDELRLRLGFTVGKAPPSGMEPVSGCLSGILEVGPAPSSFIRQRRGSTNCRNLSSEKELGKERNPSAISGKIEISIGRAVSRLHFV
ncbi:DNA-binding protein RFX2 [Striga asiatica]|uniref:DNA-binding protein RFX2 n=1 Tax=Striga asiatica TaxID=4170 RepID=A0A5A7R8U4_STRAF|nr:DNA-binding protein RFX2 [Striga asiatica]